MNVLLNLSKFKKAVFIGVMGSSVLLMACQSTPTAPVMQRQNATFDVTGTGATKNKALEEALASAKKTCGLREVIVLTDQVKYNGVLGERTDRLVNKAGAVVGAVLGTAKPDLGSDEDYEYHLHFKCQ